MKYIWFSIAATSRRGLQRVGCEPLLPLQYLAAYGRITLLKMGKGWLAVV